VRFVVLEAHLGLALGCRLQPQLAKAAVQVLGRVDPSVALVADEPERGAVRRALAVGRDALDAAEQRRRIGELALLDEEATDLELGLNARGEFAIGLEDDLLAEQELLCSTPNGLTSTSDASSIGSSAEVLQKRISPAEDDRRVP
jgi:hypothetical protein